MLSPTSAVSLMEFTGCLLIAIAMGHWSHKYVFKAEGLIVVHV